MPHKFEDLLALAKVSQSNKSKLRNIPARFKFDDSESLVKVAERVSETIKYSENDYEFSES